MKKFIEPEIVSVELSSMEAIMDSANLVNPNENLQSVDLQIKDGFTEWKGFGSN